MHHENADMRAFLVSMNSILLFVVFSSTACLVILTCVNVFHCFVCDGFRHKAIVSLKYIPGQSPSQGVLTIVRPKIFGGKLEISLRQDTSNLISISGKDARRHHFKIH